MLSWTPCEAIDTKHDIIGQRTREINGGNYSEALLAGGVTKPGIDP
jgi:hypothetical protein